VRWREGDVRMRVLCEGGHARVRGEGGRDAAVVKGHVLAHSCNRGWQPEGDHG
jgi:hypothetical protein